MFLLMSFIVTASAQNLQYADVGFHGTNDYVGVEISSEINNPDYKFSLCSNGGVDSSSLSL
jgi:hypothetical protein